ncbi:hypothetical protein MBLNU230_g7365t1 [Neophaeotheca triangularis]
MAPRDALPIPEPYPAKDVTDFGHIYNETWEHAAAPFTHGLEGVDQTMNFLFVNVLLIMFMGLLAATLVYRWVNMGRSHLRHMVTLGPDRDQRYWMHNHNTFWPWIKKNLLYAPLGKVRHNREVQLSKAISVGTLPSRFHTLLLTIYLGANIAYCVALDYGTDEHSAAIVAQARGRTGILAILNLIPTVLFALRNNPLIHITRVSYDTFNLLHRWCARVVIIESVAHTICWAVNVVLAGGWQQLNISLATSTSFAGGMVGTVVFCAIGIGAISPLRHAFYETFLNTHRLMVIVALAGTYIHVDWANLPFLPYMHFVFALWAAEWIWRFGRIAYHNISRKTGVTKITVEALPAEACRVTFELARPWRYTPGCHVHAYIPTLALWSSHPFSVAWGENKPKNPPLDVELEKMHATSLLPASVRADLTTRASTYSTANYQLATNVEVNKKITHANDALPRSNKVTSISLIMRARTGMTRKLYDKAAASPTSTFTTWGAIEGPYGGHESMASYGTVILFAGGVGITHAVGYVHHLLSRYQQGTTSVQRILLVWSVPNTEALEWVRVWMDQILRMEGRRDVLRIQLFVTKPRHRGEVLSNTGSVQMFPGRCNPTTVLEKEMQDRIGAVGVTVCGPGAFADSVRAAVRGVVTQGAVDFVEEAFTY